MITIATIPEIGPLMLVHYWGAILSFMGFFLGGLFYWTIIIREAILNAHRHRGLVIVGTALMVVVVIVIWLIVDWKTLMLRGSVVFLNTIIPLAAFEWILFICIFFQILILFMALPD